MGFPYPLLPLWQPSAREGEMGEESINQSINQYTLFIPGGINEKQIQNACIVFIGSRHQAVREISRGNADSTVLWRRRELMIILVKCICIVVFIHKMQLNVLDKKELKSTNAKHYITINTHKNKGWKSKRVLEIYIYDRTRKISLKTLQLLSCQERHLHV